MPIVYNGTTITNVVYNGTAVDTVVYNGVTVWTRSQSMSVGVTSDNTPNTENFAINTYNVAPPSGVKSVTCTGLWVDNAYGHSIGMILIGGAEQARIEHAYTGSGWTTTGGISTSTYTISSAQNLSIRVYAWSNGNISGAQYISAGFTYSWNY